MKNWRKVSAVLFLLLLLTVLVPGQAPCAALAPEGEAAKAITAFGVDLYGQIRNPDGNLVFSPYSISIALAMAYAGARGKTESQMAKTLHLSLSQTKVNQAFAVVSTHVLAAGKAKDVEIDVANALWAEKSFSLLKEFLESVRINYQGDLRQVDFKNQPEPARNAINKWVEEQTRNKIRDLMAPGTITPATRLVLTNAIYFKGKWANEFEKKWTKDDHFTLIDGAKIMVPMMHQTESLGYAEEPDLQVLEMSYKDRELEMIVLLPSKQTRLEDFERTMTSDKLDQWVAKALPQKVTVFLPRFNMTSEFLLRTALSKLGMTDAFSLTNADFSGMTGKKDLFISEVIHKAFVETNEEGTEAAAATGVAMPTGAAPRPEHLVPIFRADHPFVFLIRHKPSNCILFMGRVARPSGGEDR